MSKKSFLFVVLLWPVASVYAQEFFSWQYNDRYFSLAAGTGHSLYMGDLRNGRLFEKGLSNASLEVECRLLNRWAARASVVYYVISGSDAYAPDSSRNRQRNLSFKSTNVEGHLSALYYLRPYNKMYRHRRKFEPYLHLGLGVTTVNPGALLANEWVRLRPLATEGENYKGVALVVPLGIGVKARINHFINLVGEVGYRYAFTDRLDDVAENYGEYFASGEGQALSNRKDEVGIINKVEYEKMIAGAKRGDPGHDAYLLLQWKLEVYIPDNLFNRSTKSWFPKTSSF